MLDGMLMAVERVNKSEATPTCRRLEGDILDAAFQKLLRTLLQDELLIIFQVVWDIFLTTI